MHVDQDSNPGHRGHLLRSEGLPRLCTLSLWCKSVSKLSSMTGELGRKQAQPVGPSGQGRKRVSLTLVRGAAGLTPKNSSEGSVSSRVEDWSTQAPKQQVPLAGADGTSGGMAHVNQKA